MTARRSLVYPVAKLGAFLLVTSLATLVLAGAISNSSDTATRSYAADFTDVTGVSAGDDVRIAGVRVGTVTSLRLIGHDLVRVGFTVAAARRLPTSVHATLKYRNLIGSRYLSLTEGDDSSGAMLPPGAVLAVSQTTNALDLTALLAGFRPLEQLINPAQLNALAGSLVEVLQGEAGSINLLFQQFADVFAQINANGSAVTSLVRNLNAVLGTVSQHSAQLGSLITNLNQWMAGLAADRDGIGSSIQGIGSLASTLTDLLVKTRLPLAHDVTSLHALAGTLSANGTTLAQAIQQLPGTVATLIRPASYGGWLNFYLCQLYTPGGVLGIPSLVAGPPDPSKLDARCTA